MFPKTETELYFAVGNAVIYKNGFYKVALKDIVEACGINGDGIYVFGCVDEIFMEVARQQHSGNSNKACIGLSGNKKFAEMPDGFWEAQKARILHIKLL